MIVPMYLTQSYMACTKKGMRHARLIQRSSHRIEALEYLITRAYYCNMALNLRDQLSDFGRTIHDSS